MSLETTEIRALSESGPLRASYAYEHPRLGMQALDPGLVALLESRRKFRNVRWQEYVPDDQADREDAFDLGTAEAASSMREDAPRLHAIMFDIDVPATLEGGLFMAGDFTWSTQGAPAWLVPSTQADHWHLYVDCDLSWDVASRILRQFNHAGVVEDGYRQVSEKRGFTALRLPWVAKEDAAAALEPVDRAIDEITRIADEIEKAGSW